MCRKSKRLFFSAKANPKVKRVLLLHEEHPVWAIHHRHHASLHFGETTNSTAVTIRLTLLNTQFNS